MAKKFITGRGDHAMFPQEAVYHQLRPGIPHDEPAERYILPGMMNAIGETPQVINDIAWVFRTIVTGHFGNVTERFGIVTGRFG